MRCLTFGLCLAVTILVVGQCGASCGRNQRPLFNRRLAHLAFLASQPATANRLISTCFFPTRRAAPCHERRLKEVQGSMHSVAHTEGFYRSFAELGRKEAGNKTYRHCAGCHSAPAWSLASSLPSTIPSCPPKPKRRCVRHLPPDQGADWNQGTVGRTWQRVFRHRGGTRSSLVIPERWLKTGCTLAKSGSSSRAPVLRQLPYGHPSGQRTADRDDLRRMEGKCLCQAWYPVSGLSHA